MSAQLGFSLWILIVIVVWSIIWKLLALWKSARKNQPVWFILLAIINTVGILEILYIYIFSEIKSNKKPVVKKKRR
jgi:methionyl-tRNA synthetase